MSESKSVVETKSACSEFKLDLCANQFNVCSECGRPKEEHDAGGVRNKPRRRVNKKKKSKSSAAPAPKGHDEGKELFGFAFTGALESESTEEDWSQICAEVKDEAARNSSATKSEEKECEAGSSPERPLLSFLRCVMIDEAYSDLFPSGANPEQMEWLLRTQFSVRTPAQLATKVPTQVYRELIFDAGRVPQEKIFAFRNAAYRWDAPDDDDAEDCPFCMSAKNTCFLFCDIDERSPPVIHRNGCADCFRESIRSQITSGKIQCCEHVGAKRCDTIIPDFVIESVFSPRSNEVQAIRKHQTLRLLASQKDVVQCPGPDCCERIAIGNPGRKEIVTCPTCTTSFCTMCKELPHYHGTTCSGAKQISAAWARWIVEDRTDFYRKIGMKVGRANDQARREAQHIRNSEALDMTLLTRCRHCPNCNRIVNKYDGCDRVICGRDCDTDTNHQHGCGHHFAFSEATPYVPTATKRAEFKPMRAEDLLKPHIIATIDGEDIPLKCSNCKDTIKGPRFQCIHCQCFDMCMKCEKQLVDASDGSRRFHSAKHAFKVIYPVEDGVDDPAVSAAAPAGKHGETPDEALRLRLAMAMSLSEASEDSASTDPATKRGETLDEDEQIRLAMAMSVIKATASNTSTDLNAELQLAIEMSIRDASHPRRRGTIHRTADDLDEDEMIRLAMEMSIRDVRGASESNSSTGFARCHTHERSRAAKRTTSSSAEKDDECPICLGTKTDPVRVRPCNHEFCRHCIVDWSSKPRSNANECPVCCAPMGAVLA
eukprot:g1951.t1